MRSSRRLSSSLKLPEKIYDVAIVGGGMVGSALACALGSNKATSSLRVLLLDRQSPPEVTTPLPVVPDLRVSTVTSASVQLFKDVGAWEDIAPPRSAAFHHMQVWDEGGNGYVRYSASVVGLENMGHVAENSILQAALGSRLKDLTSVTLLCPASVESLALPRYASTAKDGKGLASGALAELTLADGQRLKARLVVGADGAKSRIRQLADLRSFSWSYHQRGVVASVRTELANTTAWQRFLPTGPLALLPVRDGFSNIVWSTTSQHALQLEEASPQDFALAVNQALSGGTLPARNPLLPAGSSEQFEPPPAVFPVADSVQKSFPLRLAGAGRYVRPRLALIGDAAHVVHPLAGQGVNLGFADVRTLSEALAHAIESGRDVGELALLEDEYEKPRQTENGLMMAVLDGLKRIFAPQSGLVASLRGLGLDVINGSPEMKRQIMKYAMGIS